MDITITTTQGELCEKMAKIMREEMNVYKIIHTKNPKIKNAFIYKYQDGSGNEVKNFWPTIHEH